MAVTNKPGRSVTSKVLAILEAFEALSSTLTLTQIAEATGVPLSTTHRLVGEMVGWAPWTGTSTAAPTCGCDSGRLRRTRASSCTMPRAPSCRTCSF